VKSKSQVRKSQVGGAGFTDKQERHWQRIESLAQQRKEWINRKYGTLGAASEVRHIDPATYKSTNET
jgi:hypothetical protein